VISPLHPLNLEIEMMKPYCSTLTAGALVLAALNSAHGAVLTGADFDPTKPARPSAGLLNDWLRQDDPYMAAWDLGTQVRFRYEVKDNFAIAGRPGSLDFRDHGADVDNAYLLSRVKPRAGYTGKWFSALVEGRFSDSASDERFPEPEEDGPIDLHQAYLFLGNHKEFPLSLKIGRQELSYGDERLVGAFDWNNLGRVFDAAKLRWQNPWFAADFFSGAVVVPDDRNFNDHNDYDWFSGAYFTTKRIPKQTTEFYFLSRNVSEKSPRFQQHGALIGLPSRRDIYTIGLRGKSNPGELGNWDYTYEIMGQFGNFFDPAFAAGGRQDHRAFAIYAGFGYTWTESSMTPRLGIEYNFASGDSDPTDGDHDTFENLFPTNHKFYGFMDFLSLQNIHNVRLQASIKPVPRLTLSLDGHLFWLADTSDNFYAVTGARRGGIAATPGTGYGINPNYGSFVGSELDVVAIYQVAPQINMHLGYGHFFVGDYIESSLSAPTHGSSDANWFYLQATFAF
jgi:hypothetical protein